MQLIAVNEQLKKTLEATRIRVNNSGFARLYANQILPDPSLKIGDLIEANFPGYNTIPLLGKLGNVSKNADGLYSFTTSDLTFRNISDTFWSVYGVYIQVGAELGYLAAFPGRYDIRAHSDLTLTVRFDERYFAV